MKTKEFIITLVFIITSLIISGGFPVSGIIQSGLVFIIFYLIVPMLFNKFILRRKLDSIGIRIGDWRAGLVWGGISLVISLMVFAVFIKYFAFLKNYTMPVFTAHNFLGFVYYELGLILFFILIYDFFFRGFIMLSFAPEVGYWAILIQAVFFFTTFALLSNSLWPFMPFILFAPLAGLIAYKSRSIIYSSAAQILMFVVLDATVIYLAK